MRVTADGLLEGALFVPSPNCDERPPVAELELLVIHSISLPPGEFGGPGIIDLFTNRLNPDAHPYFRTIFGQRVSAHLLIRRGGEAIQFVSCDKRAWHAGVSMWRGRPRCNDFSVGIELEGSDDAAFTPAQYDRLAAVTVALMGHYPIVEIVGHSDIAPGRKTDPGPQFDWAGYRRSLAV